MQVLILYDNRSAAMEPLAQAIQVGASDVPGTEVILRTTDQATREDLLDADALVLGCPNWSGMTAQLKGWLDDAEGFWEERVLVGRVGAAFTAGRFRAAGDELTLLQMIHWIMTHGMIPVGLPWDDGMRDSSSSYYGIASAGPPTEDDLNLARALGQRVAEVARRLNVAELGPF